LILILGLTTRIIFMIFFCDLKKDDYSEYGCIAKNINSGNGYSLFYIQNDTLKIKNNPSYIPYPSAFMPPGYVYFLLPFLKIENVQFRNILIYSSQIILSLILIIAFFHFSSKYFSYRICIISSIIICLLPEFVYSTFIFNAIIHYHILVTLILLILLNKDFFINYKKAFLFFLLSTVTIYFRMEFTLFVFFVFILLAYKKKFGHIIIGALVTLSLLSPWIIRNYVIFDKFIPFTTNAGLNFYRGHNSVAIGDWGSQNYINDISKNVEGNNFEILFTKYYFQRGFESFSSNMSNELVYPFIKLFNLFIINQFDDRSYNLLYLIPTILIFLLAIIGIIKSFSIIKYKFIYIFILQSSIIAVMFFALPRYQTMMKIALIPFAAVAIDLFWQFFKINIFRKILITFKSNMSV